MRATDVIVVGAGTAGSVLAARLSEDPSARVVLIEAGGTDRRPDVMIPGAASRLHRSAVDWGFYTTPQRALSDRAIYVPRGKVLGGTGSTNTLIAVRGVPLDYDEWRGMGATGWGWDDVRPVFERIGALMPALRASYVHPLSQAYLDAAREAGMKRDETGFAREELEGAGLYGVHVRDGMRWSTARAYLRPAMRRANLQVITNAEVRSLRFEDKRCVGVELRRGGTLETIRAEREVVLAAGAIGSAHLLLLSGIGPPEHLRALGIEARHDLPVGEGLQDHPLLQVADACREPISVNTTIERPRTVLAYVLRREGLLAWPLPSAGGFARTKEGLRRPDVQLLFVAGWARDPHDYDGRPQTDGYTLAAAVCKPKSRGRLRLASPHAHEPPAIDPALLEDEEDFATMMRGYALARRILDARAFDRHRAGPLKPPRALESERDIAAYVRAECGTTYHPSCTCAIGSVVDAELRVKGIGGLRVADASVMPSVTTANTNLPTIMIGERAADMMRAR